MSEQTTLRDFILERLDVEILTHGHLNRVKDILKKELKGYKFFIIDNHNSHSYHNYLTIPETADITIEKSEFLPNYSYDLKLFGCDSPGSDIGNNIYSMDIAYPLLYTSNTIENYIKRIEKLQKDIESWDKIILNNKVAQKKDIEKQNLYKQIIELMKEKGKEILSEEDYIAYTNLMKA